MNDGLDWFSDSLGHVLADVSRQKVHINDTTSYQKILVTCNPNCLQVYGCPKP